MGAIDTNYTFTATDVITSTKMNNILDQSTITDTAIIGTTLAVTTGKLSVKAGGITSNELAANAVTTTAILDGSVTLAKLSNILFIPAGAVMAFAMNTAPAGWLAANNAEYLKTDATYAALFSAIGITYGETNGSGGAGTTHFRVPDLRGYFVRGSGTNSDGTASGSFAAKQADEFLAHTHSVNARPPNFNNGPNIMSTTNATGGFTIETSSTGGTETRPKNIAMFYCIKT
jgi:microcystin-dependent protein